MGLGEECECVCMCGCVWVCIGTRGGLSDTLNEISKTALTALNHVVEAIYAHFLSCLCNWSKSS